MTLAKGAGGGPRVNLPLMQCQEIVSIYRSKNHKDRSGWKTCGQIIEDMAVGASGSLQVPHLGPVTAATVTAGSCYPTACP